MPPALEKGDNAMANPEYKAAEQTYTGFLGLLKTGIIATGLIVVLVILLIS